MNDTATVAIAVALAGGGVLLATQLDGRSGARIRGGQVLGLSREQSRRLEVRIDGHNQASVAAAQRAAVRSLRRDGRVRLTARDRSSGASVDCNLDAGRRGKGRALGGKVGRYEVGGHRYVTFSQAQGADARIREDIRRLDAQLEELRKRRRELVDRSGIVDRSTGAEFNPTAGRGGRRGLEFGYEG